MKALPFLIHLDEPLLATQPHSGEANSAISHPYVPGSMLRGALIHAYQRGKTIPDLLEDETARSRFFEGGVRFLHAYPVHPSSQKRMLPTPRSWFVAKDDVARQDAPISDFAVEINTKLEKPKPPQGASFAAISGGSAYLGSPRLQLTVHNTSEDRNRKAAGQSQVYRYEALAAGQTFGAAILSDDRQALESLKKLLEDERIFLGGSHTAGYGSVSIHTLEIEESWPEYPPASPADGKIILTLLSDAILRDENGHPAADFCQALGIEVAQCEAFQAVQPVGGFNHKWGLPLPQAWAVAAGSVFCLPAGALTPAQLGDLVENGLGERREDGYGRVAVNWQAMKRYQRAELPKPVLGPPPDLSPESQSLAQRITDRLLRQRLEEQLVNKVIGYRGSLQNLPKAAQLSRVRVVARTALLNGEPGKIARHLDNLKGTKEDWKAARVGKEPLFEWVKTHSQLSGEKFRQVFGLTADLPQLERVTAQVTPQIEHEYSLRLIDGVLKLAIEQAKKEAKDGGGR